MVDEYGGWLHQEGHHRYIVGCCADSFRSCVTTEEDDGGWDVDEIL